MKKITIIFVIIALIAVIYNKTCKAESVPMLVKKTVKQLTPEQKTELTQAVQELESIDWEALDRQAEDLINRADDMLCRLEERIERIKKFQNRYK